MVRELVKQELYIADRRIMESIYKSLTREIPTFMLGSNSVNIEHNRDLYLRVHCSDEILLNRITDLILKIEDYNLVSESILENGIIVRYKMDSNDFEQIMYTAELDANHQKRIEELKTKEKIDFTYYNLELVNDKCSVANKRENGYSKQKKTGLC